MSETCNNDCSSCSESCADRKEQQTDFKAKLNELSKVGKVYGVLSGKGGVGKSMITSMMAVQMNKKGYKTAVLDADITGKSVANADKILSTPLKKIGSKSIDSANMPEDKLKINLTNQPTFKKALFEIEFRPTNTSILPRLSQVELQVNPKE